MLDYPPRMTSTRSIRRATDADAAAVDELWAAGDRHHARALPRRFREAPRSATSLVIELADPNVALFLAEQDGNIVGAIRVVLRTANPYPNLVSRTFGEINSVVVRETHRGRGIGTALIEVAHEWTLERGADEIELNVWEFNREAIALYKRLGYAKISCRMSKHLT